MALPTVAPLKAPFPYFGGKSRVASLVWERFGDVRNFVEPFFGSGAMLLGRPAPFAGTETVNDADGLVSNFWRALQADPEAVARHADWPVNENDLHARHAWLVARKDSLQARLEGDPDYYDPKIAGWWAWGLSCWIGGGWCSGNGPWSVVETDAGPVLAKSDGNGEGVNRKRVHLGADMGVNRQRVHLGTAGMGVNRKLGGLVEYFAALAARLRNVRVCCGDWSRVCGHTPTVKMGLTAVFLDPPYAVSAGRDAGCYRVDDATDTVSARAREWAIDRGDDPRMRICLAGYEGEHSMPDSWSVVAWKAHGGMANRSNGRGRANKDRERLWFSPHCLPALDDRPLIRDERA